MLVSKSISIDVEDLLKIEKKVKEGKNASISSFVQEAVKRLLSEECG
ncbi:hypothetical protein [Methanobacterium sp. CWC-01]|nr:hypothetical protein [Methanobacterium sp. CWC-01]